MPFRPSCVRRTLHSLYYTRSEERERNDSRASEKKKNERITPPKTRTQDETGRKKEEHTREKVEEMEERERHTPWPPPG
jgi:hypothetical protein